MYYQFVLRVKDGLPITQKKRYKKEKRAWEALRKFKRNSVSGAMLTFVEGTLAHVLEF